MYISVCTWLYTSTVAVVDRAKAEYFSRLLPPPSSVSLSILCLSFPPSQDFSHHCKEINGKIMSVMDDMISRHLSKVLWTDYHSNSILTSSSPFPIFLHASVGGEVTSALCLIQDPHQTDC